MIDRAPEIGHPAAQLHVQLVKVPLPTMKATHAVNPRAAYNDGEEWTKPVPPQKYRLVAKIIAALELQILDVAQLQRKADVKHHDFADHLRSRMKVAKRIKWLGSRFAAHLRPLAVSHRFWHIILTMPGKRQIARLNLYCFRCKSLAHSCRDEEPQPVQHARNPILIENGRLFDAVSENSALASLALAVGQVVAAGAAALVV